MGQGFTVTPFVLEAGGQDMFGLQQPCQAIARDVAKALTGMAGAAGHPGLSAALTDAAGQGLATATTVPAARAGHTTHCCMGPMECRAAQVSRGGKRPACSAIISLTHIYGDC